MAPQPASKSSELIDTINNLMLHGENLDAVSIKRMEKDIESVRNVSIAEGSMLQGMLGVFLRDLEKMKNFYKEAIKKSGNLPLIMENYARSLSVCGESREAVNIIKNIPASAFSIKLALDLGAYSTAYEKADSIKQGREFLPYLQYLNRQNLSEDAVIDVISYIAKNAWAQGIFVLGAEVTPLGDSVLHSLMVSETESIEKLINLEDELGNYFAQQEDRLQRRGFSFSLEVYEQIERAA